MKDKIPKCVNFLRVEVEQLKCGIWHYGGTMQDFLRYWGNDFDRIENLEVTRLIIL